MKGVVAELNDLIAGSGSYKREVEVLISKYGQPEVWEAWNILGDQLQSHAGAYSRGYHGAYHRRWDTIGVLIDKASEHARANPMMKGGYVRAKIRAAKMAKANPWQEPRPWWQEESDLARKVRATKITVRGRPKTEEERFLPYDDAYRLQNWMIMGKEENGEWKVISWDDSEAEAMEEARDAIACLLVDRWSGREAGRRETKDVMKGKFVEIWGEVYFLKRKGRL